MADNTYYGAGTYGAGTYGIYQVSPDGSADAETIGAPTATAAQTAAPAGVNDTGAQGTATITSAYTATPGGVADGEGFGPPTSSTATTVSPAGINDPETAGGPTATSFRIGTPNGIGDPEAFGAPTGTAAYTAAPAGIGEAEAFGPPASTATPGYPLYGTGTYGQGTYSGGTTQVTAINAGELSDPETFGPPSFQTAWTVFGTGIADPETFGPPATTVGAGYPDYGTGAYGQGIYSGGTTPVTDLNPDTIGDGETFGPPLAAGLTSTGPETITDAESIGAPDAYGTSGYPDYGTGLYGQGVYGGGTVPVSDISPTGIADPETQTGPNLWTSGTVVPASITDGEGFGAPDASIIGANNTTYGTGDYGTGYYSGGTTPVTAISPDGIVEAAGSDAPDVFYPAVPSNTVYGGAVYGQGIYPGLPTPPKVYNYSYGSGLYGTGPYYGITPSENPPNLPSQPLFANLGTVPKAPIHILGIGPWAPYIVWGGVSNAGISKSTKPARPIIAMPAATALSFTLRLTDGDEASASFTFPRDQAINIEEMHTDLWWRRKDPYTGKVEVIGRFNTGTNDLAGDGTAVTSSVHFVDYVTLLNDRMVLKYLNTYYDAQGGITAQESQWGKGTAITEIMRFAIPTNMGLDLSAIADDGMDLGTVTAKGFTLPPDTTMADLFNNLLAVSSKKWEWWIEQPSDFSKAPALRFQIGQRGTTKGVVLFDTGAGPSNIANWRMQAATTAYANAIYFQGGSGGVVETIDAQIAEYGQRDAKDSNSSLGGVLTAIQAAATKKLTELADRRPTFTITLAPGFWRGRAHIDLGDTVRVYIRMGKETLDYTYRVTELQVDVDVAGAETVSLTLGTPLPSGDPRSRRSALFRLVRTLKDYTAPPGSETTT